MILQSKTMVTILKMLFFVYNAILEYDNSKCSFLTVLHGKIINLIFWVKISVIAITVIYGLGIHSAAFLC